MPSVSSCSCFRLFGHSAHPHSHSSSHLIHVQSCGPWWSQSNLGLRMKFCELHPRPPPATHTQVVASVEGHTSSCQHTGRPVTPGQYIHYSTLSLMTSGQNISPHHPRQTRVTLSQDSLINLWLQ